MVLWYICTQILDDGTKCGAAFTTVKGIQDHHYAMRHYGTEVIDYSPPSPPAQTYTCSVCGWKFNTLKELQDHTYATGHRQVTGGQYAFSRCHSWLQFFPFGMALVKLRNRVIPNYVHEKVHPLI